MKSIKEKAEAYDKVLEWATEAHKVCDGMLKEDLEHLFPELKESKDEKIKRFLLESFKSLSKACTNGFYRDDITYKDVVAWLEKQSTPQVRTGLEWVNTIDDACDKRYAEEYAQGEYCHEQSFKWGFQEGVDWLEKQGEKKPIWHNEDEEPQKDSLILLIMQSGTPIVAKIIEPNHTFNHGERWAYIDDLLEKQDEQKPAEWSEEDKVILNNIIWGVRMKFIKPLDEMDDRSKYKKYEDFLKSLPKRFSLHPRQELSEEDETVLNNLIYALANDRIGNDRDEYVSWLKSLKERYTWKPSEGQLECLGYAIEKAEKDWSPLTNNRIYLTLKALKEQLLELKGSKV